ncbi:MAG: GIY-YIG nuclease family protein [Candidatus Omnitrophica bacterium]|nr:GIY-YIG nuclease family protein [Candidatus Omnitrophota bacterium]
MKKVRPLKIPWDYVGEEALDRGSYLLILRLKQKRYINVGSLGKIFFKEGFYIYVGSAMANLTQRIDRHKRINKPHHWHIDELTTIAEFYRVFLTRSSSRLECNIAMALAKIANWSIRGFGSSDCNCETHLFGIKKSPLLLPKFHSVLNFFRMDHLFI